MQYIFAIIITVFVSQAHSLDWQQKPQIKQLFDDAGVRGTFVLYDVTGNHFSGHNHSRATTRFIPASTFKVANSLIGLATGAANSVNEIIPYGGQPQPYKHWEQDMGLADAIRISNVPVYQELARRIGLERMRDHITKLQYGNAATGAVVDTFWLKGPLAISAVEQTRFLARLAQGSLPLATDVQAQVRNIILLEQGKDWALYAKTGTAITPSPDIGWWVGWVVKNRQTQPRVYSFAVNIDLLQQGDAAKRIALGKASLKALGIIPTTPANTIKQ